MNIAYTSPDTLASERLDDVCELFAKALAALAPENGMAVRKAVIIEHKGKTLLVKREGRE